MLANDEHKQLALPKAWPVSWIMGSATYKSHGRGMAAALIQGMEKAIYAAARTLPAACGERRPQQEQARER